MDTKESEALNSPVEQQREDVWLNYDVEEVREQLPEEERSKLDSVLAQGKEMVAAMWATRQTGTMVDRRIFVKTTLRELILYVIFLILILIICLVQINPTTYYFYIGSYNILMGASTKYAVQFDAIRSDKDVWKYLTAQFLDALYPTTWYNQRNVPFIEKGFINFDNKLLGLPRIRQLRVRPHSCSPKSLPPQVIRRQLVNDCFADYYTGAQANSRIPFKSTPSGFQPKLTKEAWTFRTASNLGSASFAGPLYNYGGSGYGQDLSRNRTVTEAILRELYKGRWIDQQTRVVLVDFTLYNSNMNMFFIVTLTFEMPAAGGVLPSKELVPARLLRYVTPIDFFVLACEILLLLFVLYYIIQEIFEMVTLGCRYWIGPWNLFDLAVICNTVVCISIHFYVTIEATRIMNRLAGELESFSPTDKLRSWYAANIQATAMLLFMTMFKLFKYIDFDRSLGQLTATLSIAANDLIGFVFMFSIVYFAFTQFGYLAFGSTVNGFSTFTQSAYSLFRTIVGDIDFASLERANFLLGPLFFMVYVFCAVFVLLNMFLAIVNDAYAKLKEENAKSDDQFKLGLMVREKAKQVVRTIRHKSTKSLPDLLREEGLLARDQIPFVEFRQVLKSHGYGDAEITNVFVHFDSDGDNVLNEGELKRLEKEYSLGRKKKKLYRPEDNDEAGIAGVNEWERLQQQSTEAGGQQIEYVHPSDFAELVERIAGIEKSFEFVMTRVQDLFFILEQVEHAKRQHRGRLVQLVLTQDNDDYESKGTTNNETYNVDEHMDEKSEVNNEATRNEVGDHVENDEQNVENEAVEETNEE